MNPLGLLRTIGLASMLSPPSAVYVQCPTLPAWEVWVRLAIASVSGASGQQKPKATTQDRSDRKPTESFLNLTVRLREDGTTEIVRATQVDGKLIARQGPATNYIYEITKDGKAYAVGFLPEGAFTLRGFEAQDGGSEKTGRTGSTTVTLNIPDTELESAKQGKIGLRIYKLKAGVAVEAVSPDALGKLVAKQSVSIQFELPGATVAFQVKQRSEAIPEPPK